MRSLLPRATDAALQCKALATMVASKPRVEVKVFSDITCPYCYLGQKRLQRAVDQLEGADVQTEWRAFLLDPSFPSGGLPVEEAMRRKFGERGPALMERVRSSGADDDAPFANWRWRPGTVKGHMLVALARKHGKSSEAEQLLFSKTYEEGENVSETSVLLGVGRQLALPEAELAAAFGSGGEGSEADEGLDGDLLRQVEEDDAVAKGELRVTGVPFFLISSGDSTTYAVSGAQPPEAFLQVFERVLKEGGAGEAAAAAAEPAGGPAAADGCA